MIDILAQGDLSHLLAGFTSRMPPILRRERLTEPLVPEVERSLAIAEAPFTLAVVGQMRLGKSTLINALVGAELAIPGVTETTATVNWFRHGTEEQSRRFRAVWNDVAGTSDEFELAEKDRWSGNSELATRTRFLEFFSMAEFLKRVHVVDTPGTRSTLAGHEQTARGFLLSEGRAEHDSQFYGGVADCIIYVLPPVTHRNDSDLLGEFNAQRRMLQSTPYNSVAVLHKWETLENPAPWREALRQSQRAFAALKASVCDVVSVSGPLARAGQCRAPQFWDAILEMVRRSTADSVETLTMQEHWFTRDDPECGLSPETRGRLREDSGLPWPCFKTLLLLAASQPFADGAALQDEVRKVSGIDRLLDFLEQRFFARARMIRASNVLNRTLNVTEKARGRLGNRLNDLADDLKLGREALAELSSSSSATKARRFIEHRLDDARSEADRISVTLRDLEQETRLVREGFAHFEQDCLSIQRLDDHPDEFERAEVVEILSLLGAYGDRWSERLGVSADADLVEALSERLDRWLLLRHSATGERRAVLEHVATRLESALRIALRGDRAVGHHS